MGVYKVWLAGIGPYQVEEGKVNEESVAIKTDKNHEDAFPVTIYKDDGATVKRVDYYRYVSTPVTGALMQSPIVTDKNGLRIKYKENTNEDEPLADAMVATLGNVNDRIYGVEVADITDPSAELDLHCGDNIGAVITCHQTREGEVDRTTFYAYDETEGITPNNPFVVAGSSGLWVAIGGTYVYDGVQISGTTGPQLVLGTTAGVGSAFLSDESGLQISPYNDTLTIDGGLSVEGDLRVPSTTAVPMYLRLQAVGTGNAGFVGDDTGFKELSDDGTAVRYIRDGYTVQSDRLIVRGNNAEMIRFEQEDQDPVFVVDTTNRRIGVNGLNTSSAFEVNAGGAASLKATFNLPVYHISDADGFNAVGFVKNQSNGLLGGGNQLYDEPIISNGLRKPNGFERASDGGIPTDSLIAYNATTRTITISPASDMFYYWLLGRRYTVTSIQTKTHPAVSGLYYFYWDSSNTLQFSTTIFNFITDVPIAYVYYDATLVDGIYFDERHGADRNPSTQWELHNKLGTYWAPGEGLLLADYTVQPASPADADNQWSQTTGIIYDEDQKFQIAAKASGSYYILYRSGTAGDWKWLLNNIPLLSSANYVYYNQNTGTTWQQTELANNKYVNYFIANTLSLNADFQVFVVQGQNTHDTLAAAQAESFADIATGTFPFLEIISSYKVTFRTNASYATEGKCRIAAVEDTRASTSKQIVSGTATNINHNSLTGLQGGTVGLYYHSNQPINTTDGVTFGSIAAPDFAGNTDLLVVDSATDRIYMSADDTTSGSALLTLTKDTDGIQPDILRLQRRTPNTNMHLALGVHYINEHGYIQAREDGVANRMLAINPLGGDVTMFDSATAGKTPSVAISGYRTGDAKRTLSVSVGATVANQADFSGLGAYDFDGDLVVGGLAVGVDEKVTMVEDSSGGGPFLDSGTIVRMISAGPFAEQANGCFVAETSGTGVFVLRVPAEEFLGGTPVIDQITVTGYTENTADYIDRIRIDRAAALDAVTNIVDYTTDIGNGATGAFSVELLSGDLSRGTNPGVWTVQVTVVVVDFVFLYDFRVKWHLE